MCKNRKYQQNITTLVNYFFLVDRCVCVGFILEFPKWKKMYTLRTAQILDHESTFLLIELLLLANRYPHTPNQYTKKNENKFCKYWTCILTPDWWSCCVWFSLFFSFLPFNSFYFLLSLSLYFSFLFFQLYHVFFSVEAKITRKNNDSVFCVIEITMYISANGIE